MPRALGPGAFFRFNVKLAQGGERVTRGQPHKKTVAQIV